MIAHIIVLYENREGCCEYTILYRLTEYTECVYIVHLLYVEKKASV